MNFDIALGIVIVVVAYAFLTFLVMRSRRTIEFIAERKLNTLREILEALRNVR